jgi:hypothetical protein
LFSFISRKFGRETLPMTDRRLVNLVNNAVDVVGLSLAKAQSTERWGVNDDTKPQKNCQGKNKLAICSAVSCLFAIISTSRKQPNRAATSSIYFLCTVVRYLINISNPAFST